MRRDLAPAPVRYGAVVLLVVGFATASVLFVRGGAGSIGEVAAIAPDRAAPAGGTDAAGAAHAQAQLASTATVARAFEDRMHTLTARLADDEARPDLHLELARLLHDGHRIPEAVTHYKRVIELDPGRASAYYDLAQAHADMGEWALAADILQDRLDQDPGDAVARYNLGAVRANQGHTDEAIRLFDGALATTTDGAMRARISEALARLRDR